MGGVPWDRRRRVNICPWGSSPRPLHPAVTFGVLNGGKGGADGMPSVRRAQFRGCCGSAYVAAVFIAVGGLAPTTWMSHYARQSYPSRGRRYVAFGAEGRDLVILMTVVSPYQTGQNLGRFTGLSAPGDWSDLSSTVEAQLSGHENEPARTVARAILGSTT